MSAYNTFNPPPVLLPGDDRWVLGTSFVAATGPTPGIIQSPTDANVVTEAAAAGVFSQQVCLASRPGGGAAPGLMVMVIASANPGVAEVDVQDSAVDTNLLYLVPNNAAYKLTVWTAVGDGTFMCYTELQPEAGAFVRLAVVLNPNAVTWKAKLRYI